MIESQQTGRVFNPEIADQVNTIRKMAQKRALIAATLLAVNASEFFTQDVEDMVTAAVINAQAAPAPSGEGVEADIREACLKLGKTEAQLAEWVRKKYGAEGIEGLTPHDKAEVLSTLRGVLAKRAA